MYRLFLSLMLAHSVAAHAAEPDLTTGTVSANKYSADLTQLYRESRLEDPRVLMAFSRAQAGREREREAFGALLPRSAPTPASTAPAAMTNRRVSNTTTNATP